MEYRWGAVEVRVFLTGVLRCIGVILDARPIGCPMGCGGLCSRGDGGFFLMAVAVWVSVGFTFVACRTRGVGVRSSPLYAPWITVVVHAEVHLGDTGWATDSVEVFLLCGVCVIFLIVFHLYVAAFVVGWMSVVFTLWVEVGVLCPVVWGS